MMEYLEKRSRVIAPSAESEVFEIRKIRKRKGAGIDRSVRIVGSGDID